MIYLRANSDCITWSNGNASIGTSVDPNLSNNHYAWHVKTYTGSALTEKLTVLGGGNVGIGTTAPLSLFNVKGQARFGYTDATVGDIRIYGTGNNYLKICGTAGNDFVFDLIGTSAIGCLGITQFNVGIGTVAPSTQLSVVNDSQFEAFNVKHSNLSEGMAIGYNGIRAIGTDPNIDISIDGKGTGDIKFNSLVGTGKVGIGTASPDAKLHVDYYGTDLNFVKLLGDESAGSHGFITSQAKDFSSAIALNAIYTTHGTTSRNNKLLQIHSNETGTTGSGLYVTHGGDISSPTHVAIATNYLGNVGIGTAAPTSRLHVAGDIDNSANRIVNSQTVNDLQSDASLHFDGSNDYVNLGASSESNFNLSSNYSFQAWVKTSAITGGQKVLANEQWGMDFRLLLGRNSPSRMHVLWQLLVMAVFK